MTNLYVELRTEISGEFSNFCYKNLPPSFLDMSFISSSALGGFSSSSLSVPVPAIPEIANPALGSNLPSTACFSTFL